MEAAAFLVALGTGLWLMSLHGWRLGYPRWLSVKLGLVVFLLLPLEGFRVYLTLGWFGPGWRQAPRVSKELERASSMEEMLEALAVPLLLLALPAVVWLSLARPF